MSSDYIERPHRRGLTWALFLIMLGTMRPAPHSPSQKLLSA